MIQASRSALLVPAFEPCEVLVAPGSPGRGRPTVAEDFMWGVRWLDADKDGRITDADLDMLVELTYGVDASSLPQSLRSMKDTWQVENGLLSVALIWRDVQQGRVQYELAKVSGCLQFDASHRLEPFGNLRDYLRCFKDYDTDRNGVICAKDLRKAVASKLGIELQGGRCRDLIREVDKDMDGVIGLNDFGALLLRLVSVEEDLSAL